MRHTDERVESEHWIPAWDGASYAANTAHHRVHDADFLASTPLRPSDRVLDLGCGSGDLTATIADLVPDGEVVGVDAQPSMLEEARTRARPNQTFVLAPAQDLPDLGSFDVVLSRAVLHWVPRADWPAVLAGAHAALRPGGWLRIECGGAGNVPKVVENLGAVSGRPCAWNFLDAGSAVDLLEAAGFDGVTAPAFVRTVGQRRHYDDASFVGWLESQVLQAYDLTLKEVADHMDGFRRADGTFDQTYVRLDLLARRP